MTERVDSVGDLEESESSSLRSLLDIRLINSEEEESDPRVKEEVCSRNNGIFNSIEVCDQSHEYRAVSVWHLILFTDILVH